MSCAFLALDVPASGTAAVMMGGRMIWGLQPGPMLFIGRPGFARGLVSSMYVANTVAMVLVLVLAAMPLFSSTLRAPFAGAGPRVVVVCLIGACTIGGKMSDVYIALVFGVPGYVFEKLDDPIAPLVPAMVLDGRVLRQRAGRHHRHGRTAVAVAGPDGPAVRAARAAGRGLNKTWIEHGHFD